MSIDYLLKLTYTFVLRTPKYSKAIVHEKMEHMFRFNYSSNLSEIKKQITAIKNLVQNPYFFEKSKNKGKSKTLKGMKWFIDLSSSARDKAEQVMIGNLDF